MKRYVHTIDAIFALALFFLFAVSLLLVLLTSAGAYKDIQARNDAAYSESTCVSYVSAKVRHANSVGSVFLDDLGGVQALCLAEEHDGAVYLTKIYCYEGVLRELFTESGVELPPESGEEILQIESLSFETSGGMLHIECVGSGGGRSEVRLSLAGEAAV